MSQNSQYIWQPQPGPQAAAACCPADFTFFGGSRGGGKGQIASAGLLTPKGYKPFAAVTEGMIINDPATGGTQEIIGVSPLGIRNIYRIIFDDKSTTQITDDHLWLYKCANRPRPLTKKSKQREWAKEELRETYSDGHLDHLRVGTTKKLIKELEGGKHSPRIPLTKPVFFDVNGRAGKSLVEPYLIGLMLGDGTFAQKSRGHILTTGDIEIADYAQSLGFFISGDKKTKDGLFSSYYLQRKTPVGKALLAWTENHKLFGKTGKDKHIPGYIFTASIEYRVAVLQGLLDSDGSVDERGHVEFTNISDSLVNGVRDLVWSLGGKATVSDPIKGTYKKDGIAIECQNYRRVYIWFAHASSLFRLPRKIERCVDSWNGGFDNMRKVVSIEYSHREPATCIKVSSPYGLYITDDYIVTHNSDCLLGRQLSGAEKYNKDWNGLIIRKKYKDFGEMRRRIDGLIVDGLKAVRIGGDQQTNYIRFANGAQITMPAISQIKQVDDFVGHQFPEIGIDECTTFPFFTKMVDKLKGSNRSPAGVPCRMFGTGNPGGPGHNEVKEYFKLSSHPPNKPFFDAAGESRVFIPSFLKDNHILCDNDPKYVRRLTSISDPMLRKAWLDGDWDVFIGQAFNFSAETHVIEDFPIPEWAEIYTTFDWGYGAPFSWAWWWVDAENRVYRFAEWYGWDGTPNQGLRLADSEIAEGILEREIKMGIANRRITRLSGPDCFSKKPDYKGGGQGPSTAEVFSTHGIHMSPGDASRSLKIRQFRERLIKPEPGKMPMMMIYASCKQFIRTIPALCVADGDPEMLDDGQEEHVFDESCHICMARPLSGQPPKKKIAETTKRINALTRGGNVYERFYEQQQIDAEQALYNDAGYNDNDDDYETVSTI